MATTIFTKRTGERQLCAHCGRRILIGYRVRQTSEGATYHERCWDEISTEAEGWQIRHR